MNSAIQDDFQLDSGGRRENSDLVSSVCSESNGSRGRSIGRRLEPKIQDSRVQGDYSRPSKLVIRRRRIVIKVKLCSVNK
jgi:hypothetical protein